MVPPQVVRPEIFLTIWYIAFIYKENKTLFTSRHDIQCSGSTCRQNNETVINDACKPYK